MKTHLIGVRKIWDASPHNAFTSLARFNGHWYCAFRIASTHMSEDGRLQVIRSRDGVAWESAGALLSPDPDLPDLRDPKLVVTEKGELLLMGAATSRRPERGRCSYLWRSTDGANWGEAQLAGVKGLWLWSLASEGGALYSAAYTGIRDAGPSEVNLYRQEGQEGGFEAIATIHTDAQFPNETSILMSGSRGVAVIRREFAPGQISSPPFNNGTALLGTSVAPYTEWEISDLGFYLGGPQVFRLPDGQIVVGARTVTSGHYMGLWEVELETRRLHELLILPSGGDCGYPGLAWHDGRLWVSYYSAHERQCCIYLAEVEL